VGSCFLQDRLGHCRCAIRTGVRQEQSIFHQHIPIRIFGLSRRRRRCLLPLRSRDLAFYREGHAVGAWHAQAGSIAPHLNPVNNPSGRSSVRDHSKMRCYGVEVGLPFLHGMSTSKCVISYCPIIPIPRCLGTRSHRLYKRIRIASHLTSSRCALPDVYLRVSQLLLRRMHTNTILPSKAWVSRRLIVGESISRWCSCRSATSIAIALLRCMLSGSHRHLHRSPRASFDFS
jgi:hypothetical protein